MTTTWQAPLMKLIGLIILLPLSITYLHLYYNTYWKNEYCFVGPHYYTTKHDNIISSEIENVANNEMRGTEDQISSSSTSSSNAEQFYGIYAPTNASQKKKKKKNDKNNNIDKRQFQQKYASTISSASAQTTSSSSSSSSWFGKSWKNRIIGGSWPSITQSSMLLSSPTSKHYLHRVQQQQQEDSVRNNSNHVISFVDDTKQWCLQSLSTSSNEKWCSDPLVNTPHDGTILYVYPPSGIWKSTTTTSSQTQARPSSVTISCPTPTTTSSSTNSSSNSGKHRQQNSKQNKNVQYILDHPSTTILLLLNIGLAFHYWNQRINPSLVCKQYTKIVVEHEYWRSFTGATSHFEPLHIGFNMMSLNTLGIELEGTSSGGGLVLYDSIVFLVYNVALIICTTIVMMGMVYVRIQWIQYKIDNNNVTTQMQLTYQEQQQKLRNTSSVGYSAVLFAWMVISTMERQSPTCPIPFFNDVCFSTYTMPGIPFLKFNVSPIVSLFVAQFIMPRVSFMGHLAGIVCGFLLHWGIFPPLEVCSPNVLIGGLFLVGCVWRRRIIPVRPLLTSTLDDEEGCLEHEEYLRLVLTADDEREGDEGGGIDHGSNDNVNGSNASTSTDPFMRSKQKKKERERTEAKRKQRTLLFVRNLIGFTALVSLFVFGWSGSLVLSQFIILCYFIFGTQSTHLVWAYTRSKAESDIIQPEKHRAGVLWRGLLMSAVLATVVDSMSMASWFVLSTLILADQSSSSLPVGLIPVSLFMTFRICVNLLAIVISSKILHDMSEVGGGIFVKVFSVVISSSKQIGDAVLARAQTRWTAFEGRGIASGRRGTSRI